MIPVGVHELPEMLTVRRPVLTDDGAGGQVVTWSTVGVVRARVSQPSAAERVAAMQAGALHTHAVYAQSEADVRRGDELVHGDGRGWRVKAVYGPSEQVYLRADAELVQPERNDEESS